ncbi:MAG TPA: orotidine-5'-phosphate decarboxylase [Bacillota bacterium]|nr:orotidine-5'-phosphate decarboxylase [Bacillota bacterium]
MPLSLKNPLIIALDVDSGEEATSLAGGLKSAAGGFKVGLQLFSSAGPDIVGRIGEIAPVFLDLKLHDIPNTVYRTVRVLARLGASILNVHAAGGAAMMRAAAEAARDEAEKTGMSRPLVVAVTVLTSIGQDSFNNEVGFAGPVQDRVKAWALLAREAGLDGVVASPREIAAVKEVCGTDFVVITPGVRPAGAAAGDQQRTLAPGEAVRAGADYIVVGRPITAAPDPLKSAGEILGEIGRRY